MALLIMAVYTYTRNHSSYDQTGRILLRGGTLELRMGSFADLTDEEVAELSDRFVLTPGAVPGSFPAVEGTETVVLMPDIINLNVPDIIVLSRTAGGRIESYSYNGRERVITRDPDNERFISDLPAA